MQVHGIERPAQLQLQLQAARSLLLSLSPLNLAPALTRMLLSSQLLCIHIIDRDRDGRQSIHTDWHRGRGKS